MEHLTFVSKFCVIFVPSRSKTVDTKLEEDNMGHQILKRMGEWLGITGRTSTGGKAVERGKMLIRANGRTICKIIAF